MKNFGKWVVGMRIPILIISFVLLIPSFFGYVGTRVNYDILSYLPKDIETMVGQDILVEEFGTGAFSMFMVEGMKPKETAALKECGESHLVRYGDGHIGADGVAAGRLIYSF